jgi:hypothetical protein
MKSPRTVVLKSFEDVVLAYRRLWDDIYNLTNKDTSVTGSLTLIGGWLYLGDKDTDGTWRIMIDSGNLKSQKRVSSIWTDAQIIYGS